MIIDLLLSFIIFPNMLSHQINYDGFLNLNSQLAAQEAKESAPQRLYTDYLDVQITSQSAIAVDAKSGAILYQKNADKVWPIASITKLMTALVFLEYNPGWQKEFYTIAADRRNGGIIYLNTGEILTIDDLFKTALIPSDNDSAMALARSTGLSENEFIKKMNAKAKELNLVDSTFTDPTGLLLSNEAIAKDIAILLNYALQKEPIAKATSTSSYEFEVKGEEKTRLVKIRNTDSLVNGYLNVMGGKTGSLELAGYNLAVKIKGEQGQEIIIVVFGSATNSDRFQDTKAVADWVFNNYKWQ